MKTVVLRGKKAAGRVALVDDEDYDLVTQYKWYLWEYISPGRRVTGPYAIAHQLDSSRRMIRMHVLIMGRPYIDHEDHDGLNNQRSNLRPATALQNQYNRRATLTGRSRFKGVNWDRRRRQGRGAWIVRVKIDGRPRYVGLFDSEEDAAHAYDAAARAVYGEYAYLNFPLD